VGRTSPTKTVPDASRSIGMVGVVLAVLGILVSVLLAVASLAAAMLVIGLLVGAVGGVAATPALRRGMIWLVAYLDARDTRDS
jgi:hypothetical protein